jgi:hypothetical protein
VSRSLIDNARIVCTDRRLRVLPIAPPEPARAERVAGAGLAPFSRSHRLEGGLIVTAHHYLSDVDRLELGVLS